MDQDYEVVIAGGGIAGLSAALASARLGRKTLVLTGEVLGGLLLSIDKVEGFPGFADGIPGYDLCPMVQEQAIGAGAAFATAGVDALERRGDTWSIVSGGNRLAVRSVILATGSTLKELGVPGEERLRHKGVSQCASCDAPLVRKRTVAVVGGGDSALQESLTLAEFAERVVVLVRGDKLAAQHAYRQRVAAQPKIEIRFNTVVEEILGAGKVDGVRMRDAGRGAAAELEVAALFVYVGVRPNTAFLHGQVKLDPSGRIPVDDRMRTELPGVFAAGIVRSGSAGRAAASAGDGTVAAIAADRYLTDTGR